MFSNEISLRLSIFTVIVVFFLHFFSMSCYESRGRGIRWIICHKFKTHNIDIYIRIYSTDSIIEFYVLKFATEYSIPKYEINYA